MYSLTVLEAESHKSTCQWGHTSSGGSRGGPLPLPAFVGWSLTAGHVIPIAASTFAQPALCFCQNYSFFFIIRVFPFNPAQNVNVDGFVSRTMAGVR